MGIRTEKKKVLQQIVNNEDSSLPLDPEPLLTPTDLHWFQALPQKQTQTEKDDKENDAPEKQSLES